MRADQIQRLKDMQEKVAEEALTALDTDLWPGAKVPVEEWTSKIRGDRNWTMKNANAAVTLLVNMKRLADDGAAAAALSPAEEEESEADKVDRAEKRARELIERLGKNAPASR